MYYTTLHNGQYVYVTKNFQLPNFHFYGCGLRAKGRIFLVVSQQQKVSNAQKLVVAALVDDLHPRFQFKKAAAAFSSFCVRRQQQRLRGLRTRCFAAANINNKNSCRLISASCS
jgi:hypothetical protein